MDTAIRSRPTARTTANTSPLTTTSTTSYTTPLVDDTAVAGRDDRGFTLIELLIVVAILGVLGGITAFAVGNLTDGAEDAACETEERTLELAIESYRATEDKWPSSIAQLETAGLIQDSNTAFELTTTLSGGVVIDVKPRAITGGKCA